MSSPKVLLLDIETLPIQIATWSLYDDRNSHKQILKDKSIVCAAWKWLGGKSGYVSILDDPRRFAADVYDDYAVVSVLYALVNEADYIVTQNGDRFDLKFINMRSFFHGFPPVKPSVSIDTLKGLRKRFNLTSSSLDYVSAFLGEGKKLSLGGIEAWMKIIDPKYDEVTRIQAVARMTRYCRHDVKLLERVYAQLAPWINNHPVMHLDDAANGEIRCNAAGCGGKVKRSGTVVVKKERAQYQAYRCTDCGHWMRGTKALVRSNVVAA